MYLNKLNHTKVSKKKEMGKVKYKWQADVKRNVNLPESVDCLISEFSCFKIGYTQTYAHISWYETIIFSRYKNN